MTTASGVLVYVHCNPITQFDAWGLETQSESRDAAEEWYNSDEYDGDEYDSFDDYWKDNEDKWYDRRAGEGYNIFTDDYADQLREANKDAQKDLFSTSASAAINERLDILAHNGVNTPEQTDEAKGMVKDYFAEMAKRYTPEQMRSIAAILEMERQQGTKATAKQVSNTWPEGNGMLQPFNADFGRNSHVNGVDIDWFTDLSSFPRGKNITPLIYDYGKRHWAYQRAQAGTPIGNPEPYSDPGERMAVGLVGAKAGYETFLTPAVFNSDGGYLWDMD